MNLLGLDLDGLSSILEFFLDYFFIFSVLQFYEFIIVIIILCCVVFCIVYLYLFILVLGIRQDKLFFILVIQIENLRFREVKIFICGCIESQRQEEVVWFLDLLILYVYRGSVVVYGILQGSLICVDAVWLFGSGCLVRSMGIGF